MADKNLAIETIFANEGGYVFNPNDPGGETNFGISKRTYPNLDIKNLTRSEATDIYFRDFWHYDGFTDQDVATKLFDIGVNQGTIIAVELLQRALNIPADGKLGPQTLAYANTAHPATLLRALRIASIRRRFAIVAHNPRTAEFLEGWCIRDAQ
jgi:lysozyme family protein